MREARSCTRREPASGAMRVVLDNTYLTRAARSHVLEAAARHGVPRCVWLETPLAQAQVNLVERILERFDALPTPDELKEIAKSEPGLLAPTSQMRALRELEPPTPDEAGQASSGCRSCGPPSGSRMRAGVFVGAAVLERPGWEDASPAAGRSAARLLFDWRLLGDADALAAEATVSTVVSGPVERAVCPRRRPARVLVPPAPPGSPARFCPRPRRRPGALHPPPERVRRTRRSQRPSAHATSRSDESRPPAARAMAGHRAC